MKTIISILIFFFTFQVFAQEKNNKQAERKDLLTLKTGILSILLNNVTLEMEKHLSGKANGILKFGYGKSYSSKSNFWIEPSKNSIFISVGNKIYLKNKSAKELKGSAIRLEFVGSSGNYERGAFNGTFVAVPATGKFRDLRVALSFSQQWTVRKKFLIEATMGISKTLYYYVEIPYEINTPPLTYSRYFEEICGTRVDHPIGLFGDLYFPCIRPIDQIPVGVYYNRENSPALFNFIFSLSLGYNFYFKNKKQ